MRDRAAAAIGDYGIKAPGPATEAEHLSGGNLQKLVLARELSAPSRCIVAASPTRGLDVAAVQMVHSRLLEAADRGAGVLLLSEDLDEILALNDRILVMYEGELSEVGDRESIVEIGLRMAGGSPAELSSTTSYRRRRMTKVSKVGVANATLTWRPSCAPTSTRS